jgi:hypothetical protein
MFEEEIFPLSKSWTSPVSVYPLDRRITIFCYLLHHLSDICGWDVITVDEYGESDIDRHGREFL